MTYGKFDVLEAFDYIKLEYYNTEDAITERKNESLRIKEMRDKNMVIKTRPRYPSDRLTFSISNITKHRNILFFDIWLKPWKIDVDVVLEDSKRNFLNSLI